MTSTATRDEDEEEWQSVLGKYREQKKMLEKKIGKPGIGSLKDLFTGNWALFIL